MTNRFGWAAIGRHPDGGWDGQNPDAMILDVGQLDIHRLADTPYTLFACDGRVRGFEVERGRRSVIDHYDAGSARVVLDNRDGELTPANTVTDDRPSPGAPLVLSAGTAAQTSAGTVADPLFSGYVDRIDTVRDAGGNDDVVIVYASDELRALAETDLPAAASQGAGETAGARIGRVLDLLDQQPAAQRLLDAGDHTLQATTLAQPLVTDAYLAADSEGGVLFVDRFGRWVFRDRTYYTTSPPTSRATFTYDTASDYRYGAGFGVASSGEWIRNDIRLARAGGTEQRTVNDTSVRLARRKNFSRSDLICETDAQVATLTELYAAMWGDVGWLYSPLEVHCERNATAAGLVCSLELGEALTVEIETPDTDTYPTGEISETVRVESIRWRYTPAGGLTATLGLSSSTASLTSFVILDDATAGKLSANNRLT